MENKYKSIPCTIELQETENGIWWKLKSESGEEAVININALALSKGNIIGSVILKWFKKRLREANHAKS
jgi:hypothetical protein